MDFNEFLNYIFTCKMSTDYKTDPNYTDEEFTITFCEDSECDSGYSAEISAKDADGFPTTNSIDAQAAIKNIFFGTWNIKGKPKKL